MKNKTELAVFENKYIRRDWSGGEWWFSVVDVIGVLTDSVQPSKYWTAMKARVNNEDGLELSTICRQFKLQASDGKKRETDCSNKEGILRIIQSIPSPKAEPFKTWLAKIGGERLDEIKNPAVVMQRMKAIYEQKGYPKEWIEKRMRSIAVRQNLTDEWDKRGANDQKIYAILTNEIMRGTFDMTVPEYKDFKGVTKQNLRDHMNDMELILTMLAEATTTELHKTRDSTGFKKLHTDAHDGGEIAGRTRKDIESQTSKKVSSKENFLHLKNNKKNLE